MPWGDWYFILLIIMIRNLAAFIDCLGLSDPLLLLSSFFPLLLLSFSLPFLPFWQRKNNSGLRTRKGSGESWRASLPWCTNPNLKMREISTSASQTSKRSRIPPTRRGLGSGRPSWRRSSVIMSRLLRSMKNTSGEIPKQSDCSSFPILELFP